MTEGAADWRSYGPGEVVRCPACGQGCMEPAPSSTVRLRVTARNGRPTPGSAWMVCRNKKCGKMLEVRIINEMAA